MIQGKLNKYQFLILDVQTYSRTVSPFLLVTASFCGNTYILFQGSLHTIYKIPKSTITKTLTQIDTITIQYLTSITLHKHLIKTNQAPFPLPNYKPL